MPFFGEVAGFPCDPRDFLFEPFETGNAKFGRFIFRVEIFKPGSSAACGIGNDAGLFEVFKPLLPWSVVRFPRPLPEKREIPRQQPGKPARPHGTEVVVRHLRTDGERGGTVRKDLDIMNRLVSGRNTFLYPVCFFLSG